MIHFVIFATKVGLTNFRYKQKNIRADKKNIYIRLAMNLDPHLCIKLPYVHKI